MALENKLGLTNSADLAREEERISKKKAIELFETGLLDTLPAGKFEHCRQFISTSLRIFMTLPERFAQSTWQRAISDLCL